MILVFHDLTRLKQLENTRKEFVANVSHELRTPLSMIKGYVETLISGAKDDPSVATRFLQTIEKHADRLTYLIEDLLTISKVEAGVFDLELDETDLHEVLAAACASVESRAKRRGHRLVLTEEGQLGTVQADGEQLQRALANLLVNGVNFTPDGGLVELAARLDGEHVEITVRDTGVGIDPEEQPQLFTRFFRGTFAVREAVQGAGLGLAITKTIVEGHGGEISVHSVPGQGTTFTIRIPRERPLWL